MKNYATDLLTRTAFHEAGHCVAGVLFGCAIGAVTIDENDGRGCAWVSHSRLRIAGDTEQWLHRPVPLWPAGVRRALEVDVMVDLAGWAGAALAPGVAAARRATPSVLALDEADEHGRRRWPALTRTEQAAIAAWQATPPEDRLDDDDTRAAVTIRLLHGDDIVTGTLHARWLNAEVRRLLGRHLDAIERVAAALLERKSLSARTVRALVRR